MNVNQTHWLIQTSIEYGSKRWYNLYNNIKDKIEFSSKLRNKIDTSPLKWFPQFGSRYYVSVSKLNLIIIWNFRHDYVIHESNVSFPVDVIYIYSSCWTFKIKFISSIKWSHIQTMLVHDTWCNKILQVNIQCWKYSAHRWIGEALKMVWRYPANCSLIEKLQLGEISLQRKQASYAVYRLYIETQVDWIWIWLIKCDVKCCRIKEVGSNAKPTSLSTARNQINTTNTLHTHT